MSNTAYWDGTGHSALAMLPLEGCREVL